MTFINWETPFYFDVATGNAGGPYPKQGAPATYIPIPTYGNYGGANYSEQQFNGDLDVNKSKKNPYLTPQQLEDTGDETNDPEDALDYLFYRHDVATDLARNAKQETAADLALLQGIASLSADDLDDPEASLYAGLTTVAISALLLEDNPTLAVTLLPYLIDALDNISTGLADLAVEEPDEYASALKWLTGPIGNTESGVVDILAEVEFGEPIDSILYSADAYLDVLNSGLSQTALIQSGYAIA